MTNKVDYATNFTSFSLKQAWEALWYWLINIILHFMNYSTLYEFFYICSMNYSALHKLFRMVWIILHWMNYFALYELSAWKIYPPKFEIAQSRYIPLIGSEEAIWKKQRCKFSWRCLLIWWILSQSWWLALLGASSGRPRCRSTFPNEPTPQRGKGIIVPTLLFIYYMYVWALKWLFNKNLSNHVSPFKGTGTRDLIWLKMVSLERS